MITFQQLIAAAFHAAESDLQKSGRFFEGSEGGRIRNFESGEGIEHYRHDAVDKNGTPLYLLYNRKSDSCILAPTSIPFRDKHFLNEDAREITSAEEALRLIGDFFSDGKKVLPSDW